MFINYKTFFVMGWFTLIILFIWSFHFLLMHSHTFMKIRKQNVIKTYSFPSYFEIDSSITKKLQSISLQSTTSNSNTLLQNKNNQEWWNNMDTVLDPMFVIFGNSDSKIILANFICNTAIFPPMHKHTLIIVTDDLTASYLLNLSSDITVVVYKNNYNYKEYELEKRHAYLDLIENNINFKSIIFLEPGAYHMQNLLLQKEITEDKMDIIFSWDHAGYYGGFMRFVSSSFTKKFYREVVNRLQTSANNINDYEIILNNIINDWNLKEGFNFSVFDKCRFRSYTYHDSISEYSKDYQSDCKSEILPVIQNNNIIFSQENYAANIDAIKKRREWFVMEENFQKCKQRDLRVVVMTMDRSHSLSRLLESLYNANYDPGMNVDIQITVDQSPKLGVDSQTIAVIQAFVPRWIQGLIEVKIWPKNVGIYGQWLDSWPAEDYPEELYKAVVLLEDDLEVSPFYARWFIGAHAVYASKDPRIGAITGEHIHILTGLGASGSISENIPSSAKAFA